MTEDEIETLKRRFPPEHFRARIRELLTPKGRRAPWMERPVRAVPKRKA